MTKTVKDVNNKKIKEIKMRIMTSQKLLLIVGVAILLSVTILFWTTLNAERSLGGPAFSDPSKIQKMSEEWRKKPIKYDKENQGADIVVSLDQQMYPSLLSIIRRYAKEHNLRIFVNEATCGISAGALERKSIDIGGFCCPPTLTDRLPNVKFHNIGISSLAIFVHPTNPIDNLTLEEARKIFMGEITHWSEIKTTDGKIGPNIPIKVIARLHCKTRPADWRLLLSNEDLFSPTMSEVGAIPDMISLVAQNPGAIGHEVILSRILHRDKGEVKFLKINGYSPDDPEALLSGRYPLYRAYHLTTWEGKHLRNPEAEKLVDYLIREAEHLPKDNLTLHASRLRKAGWKFKDNELIGEPK